MRMKTESVERDREGGKRGKKDNQSENTWKLGE